MNKPIHSITRSEGLEEDSDGLCALKSKARYQLRELFGEDAFYDHLEDVVKQYREQFNLPIPSRPIG